MPSSPLTQELKTYLFSYRHDGAEWCLEIKAKSEQDAKARLERIQFASYDGELIAKLPVGFGFFARAAVLVRNLFA